MNRIVSKLFIYIDRIVQKAKREEIICFCKEKGILLGDNVCFTESAQVNYTGGSKIEIGTNTSIAGIINMIPGEKERALKIGENCYIGDNSRIWCMNKIEIGNRVLIAHDVNIFDNTTHPIAKGERYLHEEQFRKGEVKSSDFGSLKVSSVMIGDDVWIGCGSIILEGVTIGNGAIVGANSVVTGDVPNDTIVVGNPAHVVRRNGEKENDR